MYEFMDEFSTCPEMHGCISTYKYKYNINNHLCYYDIITQWRHSMKILMIFTGGTIGSTLKDGYIGLDSGKPYKLIENYKSRYGTDPELEITTAEPVNFLSENSTGTYVTAVVNSVLEHMNDGYDGIIVTHGTDTLQYTAAAIGYALGTDTIPVCMVSSDRPVEDPDANGLINLHGAFAFIRSKAGRGAFVVYRNNPEDVTVIHRATKLIAHQTLSSELFSISDEIYGVIDEKDRFTPNEDYKDDPDEAAPIPFTGLTDTCTKVMRIIPFPGMIYPEVPSSVQAIVHEAFHSGTINTASNDSRRFFDEMHSRGIRVYLTGTTPGADYESTKLYDDLHIIPVPGISPIALYMKLWMTL